ncbi:glycosyltransferase family 4 protein [soil metagenome]
MRINQLLIGANPGDAVTEAALRLRGALSAIADAEVYAVHIHPALADQVHRIAKFPLDGTAEDVLIVHVSIGEPGVVDWVANCPERVILNYHNITPASYFDDFEPEFSARLRAGRWDLKSLVRIASGAIAHSQFNARELEALGMTNVDVSPPPLHLGRLHDVQPDPAFVEELSAITDPVVLVVGQILPHKRPELAVQAQHLLNVNHLPNARLFVAGMFTNPRYSSALVRHVESLKLSTVRVMGSVSDAQLAALYRRADVLLVPSEHEGFCVPLAEAFSFGVPVVTRDFAAIPETAAGAAIVLPRTAGAAELCEALNRVLTDADLRAELARRGERLADDLSAVATLEGALRSLARVLERANVEAAP